MSWISQGIRAAVEKKVVPASPPVEPLTKLDVLGKTADEVAAEIVRALGEAPASGCVLVLQGLSGTGKGTTVAKLQASLPRATCWSDADPTHSALLTQRAPSPRRTADAVRRVWRTGRMATSSAH